MSSRTREKAAARERVAAMRAAQARAARRRRVALAGGSVGVVLVVVVALVVAKVSGVGDGGSAPASGGSSGPAGQALVDAVTGVPAKVLDQVGDGGAKTVPKKIDAPDLTADGKPRVLYVGAEFCPFCAAQRWPVVVALSRFGTWSGLGRTTSASDDVHPDTATLTFHGAIYTSDLLSFSGVETLGREKKGGQYPPLDDLTAADQKLVDTYDRPPYTEGSAGGIPFLDLGGRYVSSGSAVDPTLLEGKTHQQIADSLSDPSSEVATAVDGTANVLTAALCELTDQKPATVCSAAGVTAAKQTLAQNQSK